MQKIIFTGGGSSGHVTPNLGLIARCRQQGWQISYIGSTNGIEKQIIQRINIPYYPIATGKLRRYVHWRTLLEPFKIFWGILQAYRVIRKIKPNIVFSKGGFVAVPVVIATWLNRITVIIHEADFTPGLANRLCVPFAKKICLTFAESAKFFKNKKKLIVTGLPIRESLFHGDADKGRQFCGFAQTKPIILIMGGGLGARRINQIVREALAQLLERYQIIHLCGKGKLDNNYLNQPGYRQFEYIEQELGDLLAAADLVISRAGSNSLYELIALRKLHILIPLPKTMSRGDQIDNALYFAKQGASKIIWQEKLSDLVLNQAIEQVFAEQADIMSRIQEIHLPDAVTQIYCLLETQRTQ